MSHLVSGLIGLIIGIFLIPRQIVINRRQRQQIVLLNLSSVRPELQQQHPRPLMPSAETTPLRPAIPFRMTTGPSYRTNGDWFRLFGTLALVALVALLGFLAWQNIQKDGEISRLQDTSAYWENRYQEFKGTAQKYAAQSYALCPTLSSVQDQAIRGVVIMSGCTIKPGEVSRKGNRLVYQMNRNLYGLQDDPRGRFLVPPGYVAEARIYEAVGLDTDTTPELWDNPHPGIRYTYGPGAEFRSDHVEVWTIER